MLEQVESYYGRRMIYSKHSVRGLFPEAFLRFEFMTVCTNEDGSIRKDTRIDGLYVGRREVDRRNVVHSYYVVHHLEAMNDKMP